MKPLGTLLALALTVLGTASSACGYDIWRHMLHAEALLDTLPFEVRHFSSWAPNGSGSDMGWYQGSAGGGWNVLCDVQGPGGSHPPQLNIWPARCSLKRLEGGIFTKLGVSLDFGETAS